MGSHTCRTDASIQPHPSRSAVLQCTGEHLQPRSNGGSNQPANIVAACRHCNGTRHPPQGAIP
ncbi:HNH endonuclease [Aeromonas popoffii]|uniref:HNH endonuclease n=1 Tax=Aeromonas popoffii TaxID=70856 RepID=UPI0030CEC38D